MAQPSHRAAAPVALDRSRVTELALGEVGVCSGGWGDRECLPLNVFKAKYLIPACKQLVFLPVF